MIKIEGLDDELDELPESRSEFPKVCCICKKEITDKCEDMFAIFFVRASLNQNSVNGGFFSLGKTFDPELDNSLMCLPCHAAIIVKALQTGAEIRFENTGEAINWLSEKVRVRFALEARETENGRQDMED